jgi:hypothetical protein
MTIVVTHAGQVMLALFSKHDKHRSAARRQLTGATGTVANTGAANGWADTLNLFSSVLSITDAAAAVLVTAIMA